MFEFKVLAVCPETGARAGELTTPHGVIRTPVFMPVGTQATVKAMTPEDLKQIGAQIILGNTYHLYIRPGHELIRELGGLHRFMHWDRPILTDSGGFQIFSLNELASITEDGASFRSHLDGTKLFLSPEDAVAVQEALGSDIMMALDTCIPYPATRAEAARATALTNRWARRCRAAQTDTGQLLFGIVQGGLYPDLRLAALAELAETGFDGYALGGQLGGEDAGGIARGVGGTHLFGVAALVGPERGNRGHLVAVTGEPGGCPRLLEQGCVVSEGHLAQALRLQFLRGLRGQFLQRGAFRVATGGGGGEQRITTPDQHQLPGGRGNDGGVEGLGAVEDRQQGGDGQQFRVRRGNQELIGVRCGEHIPGLDVEDLVGQAQRRPFLHTLGQGGDVLGLEALFQRGAARELAGGGLRGRGDGAGRFLLRGRRGRGRGRGDGCRGSGRG